MLKMVKALFAGAVLLSTIALGGCGAATPAPDRPTGEVANISFASPAITGPTIPSRYTCDGQNVAPPLEWGAVPPKTREIAIFLLGLTPSASGSRSISIEWAIAGVSANLHKLSSGQLPRGAQMGTTTRGPRTYNLCPKKGQHEEYEFVLYAIPHSVKVRPHFRGLQALGALTSTVKAQVKGRGRFATSYTRA
jgi:phosphatidylethanolamine-binding protein (PEBP) family uncharacterized protein